MPDTQRSKADIIALLATNASGDISAQDLRDVVESLQPSFGSFYVSASTPTTGLTKDIWAKALGTTAPGVLNRFSHSNNSLVYTGLVDTHLHLAASVSFTSAGNNDIIGVGIAKNGVILEAPMFRFVGTGSDIGSTAVHADVMVSTNDNLEIWVRTNSASGANVTLVAGYLFAMGMLV